MKHGRYSTVARTRLGDLLEAHEADPDPLDLLPELALLRGLLEDFLDRAGEDGPDVEAARSLVSEIGRTVERVEKAQSRTAVTVDELARVFREIRRGLDLYVTDRETRERLADHFASIKLEGGTR